MLSSIIRNFSAHELLIYRVYSFVNKNLIKDTIDNIKNPKHSIPFKNRLINSRIRYVYPTINNKINDEN